MRSEMRPQGDFDVRWLRGSASDLIFAPWLSAIEKDGGRVLGGKRVSTIRFKDQEGADAQDLTSGGDGDSGGEASPVRVETTDGEVFEADAVVLAVGITAAKVSTLPPVHFYLHSRPLTRYRRRFSICMALVAVPRSIQQSVGIAAIGGGARS